MRYVAGLALAVLILAVTAAPGQDTDKEEKVRELIALMRVGDSGEQVAKAVLAQMKKLPDADAFVAAFRKAFVARTAARYRKLDDATLDAALRFYRTPAGRKLAATQPDVSGDAFLHALTKGREALLGQRGAYEAQLTEDMNSLRNLVGLLAVMGKLPLERGRVDVYALVRRGDLRQQHFKMLRSARRGVGPTDAEIRKADYTNFPYGRFRGPVAFGANMPLLWDKQADARNRRLIGWSNGAVRRYTEAEAVAILRKHKQVP